MIIENKTSINLELVKAIALDVGLDLRVDAVLELEYIGELKGGMKGDNSGEFFAYDFEGVTHLVVRVLPWATTETLAHELRHAAQCLELGGFDNMAGINEIELASEGYWENVLEQDAREAGERWKV